MVEQRVGMRKLERDATRWNRTVEHGSVKVTYVKSKGGIRGVKG